MTVRLRPIVLGDAAAIQRYAADTRIAATTNVPHPYPPDGGQRFVEDAIAAAKEGRRYPSAVIADGDFAGVIGFNAIDRRRRTCRMDFWIAVPLWDHGLATMAARQAVPIAFQQLDVRLIRSTCLKSNAASARVLEKVGFSEVGQGISERPKFLGQAIRRFGLRYDEWTTA